MVNGCALTWVRVILYTWPEAVGGSQARTNLPRYDGFINVERNHLQPRRSQYILRGAFAIFYWEDCQLIIQRKT